MGAQIPPNCSYELQGDFVEYVPRKKLVAVFPTQEKHTNPMGNLQGGILTALFDDTVGPLSYLVARAPAVTTNLQVNFIRGVKPPVQITISAEVISVSTKSMIFQAEARDPKGRLVATMTSHNLILK